MRAIVVDRPGGPEVLQVRDAPSPPVGPNDARVAVRAVAVNFRDVHSRRGTGGPNPDYPIVPGSDFAGDVVAVGEAVTEVDVGDRVLGVSFTGAYAEEVTTAAAMLFRLPEGFDYNAASTVPVAGLTASYLLSAARVERGMTVATLAAAGGLGCYLGGVLAEAGVASIGITSSAEKAEVARHAHHRHVVSYREQDPVVAVRELTDGRGVDVVFDSVGGSRFGESFRMLGDGGEVVLCGRAAGEPSLESVTGEFIEPRRNLALRDFNLTSSLMHDFAGVPARIAALVELLSTGKVNVPITVFPLGEAAAAHELMEAGRSVGKLVLRP